MVVVIVWLRFVPAQAKQLIKGVWRKKTFNIIVNNAGQMFLKVGDIIKSGWLETQKNREYYEVATGDTPLTNKRFLFAGRPCFIGTSEKAVAVNPDTLKTIEGIISGTIETPKEIKDWLDAHKEMLVIKENLLDPRNLKLFFENAMDTGRLDVLITDIQLKAQKSQGKWAMVIPVLALIGGVVLGFVLATFG